MRARYVLTFYAEGVDRGGRHQLKISLRNGRADITVRPEISSSRQESKRPGSQCGSCGLKKRRPMRSCRWTFRDEARPRTFVQYQSAARDRVYWSRPHDQRLGPTGAGCRRRRLGPPPAGEVSRDAWLFGCDGGNSRRRARSHGQESSRRGRRRSPPQTWIRTRRRHRDASRRAGHHLLGCAVRNLPSSTSAPADASDRKALLARAAGRDARRDAFGNESASAPAPSPKFLRCQDARLLWRGHRCRRSSKGNRAFRTAC